MKEKEKAPFHKELADLFIEWCIRYDETKEEAHNPSWVLYVMFKSLGFSKKHFIMWLDLYFPTLSYKDAVAMMDNWLFKSNIQRFKFGGINTP